MRTLLTIPLIFLLLQLKSSSYDFHPVNSFIHHSKKEILSDKEKNNRVPEKTIHFALLYQSDELAGGDAMLAHTPFYIQEIDPNTIIWLKYKYSISISYSPLNASSHSPPAIIYG